MLLDLAAVESVVKSLMTAYSASHCVLAPEQRLGAEQLLGSALLGPVTSDEYCDALQAILDQSGATNAAWLSPMELPIDELIAKGLTVLADKQLCLLGLNKGLFQAVSTALWDSMATGSTGDFWWDACIASADSLPPDYAQI